MVCDNSSTGLASDIRLIREIELGTGADLAAQSLQLLTFVHPLLPKIKVEGIQSALVTHFDFFLLK